MIGCILSMVYEIEITKNEISCLNFLRGGGGGGGNPWVPPIEHGSLFITLLDKNGLQLKKTDEIDL